MYDPEEKTEYEPPAIIHEQDLETRAGSVPELPAHDPFESEV